MNKFLMMTASSAAFLAVATSAMSQQAAPSTTQALAPSAQVIPSDSPIGGGPFKAIMEVDPGLTTHTVYRPKDLAVFGTQKLPVVVWGNGACVNVGNRFRWFLSEVASYGYVIVAIGPIGPASMEAAPQPAPARPADAAPTPPRASTAQGGTPPARPAPATRSAQLIDAMNWLIAENERNGSHFYQRLDTKKVGVMGQSCGGVQAIEASADPRVTTSMIWNSGLFNEPSTMAGGKLLSKEDLKLLHAPIAYISGDSQDVAFPNANDDFQRLSSIPVFRGWEHGVPHTGTYRDANGGEFSGVAVAWLNWQLKGDKKSEKMFVGDDCGLCVNPRWIVSKKNIK